jgi:hypothetical protein
MNMRMSATAQVGFVVLLAAITGFLGTRAWVVTRTLRAVDMRVSLARGIISTGKFRLNAHGFYSILFGEEQGGPPPCNVELETRRISSIGGLPVYRYQSLEDESRAKGRNTIAGYFLGGFEGKPGGSYQLEIEVVSDTSCLDVGKPRLYILASNEDFNRLYEQYESLCYFWGFVGLLGFLLVTASVYEAHRKWSDAKRNPSMFR